MKELSKNGRSLLCAVAGLLTIVAVSANPTPVRAQAADAAELCTPDVMRLCNEYIPDADRIVGCLKAKRRQLSPGCAGALSGKARRHRVRKSAT